MSNDYSEINKNIFVLHDGMFPLYLIRGEKNVLIDCSILARVTTIENQLERIIPDETLHYLLFTHSHYDHTGACSELQEKYGFSIFCSQRTKEILQNPDAIQFIDDLNQKFKKMEGDKSSSYFTMPKNLNAVYEGDRIQVDADNFFLIYETPGHTRCSISFLLYPQNILFCGDAAGIIEKSGKIKPLFLSSYLQYKASLEKLAKIETDILALPHNVFVKGQKRIRNFFQEALNETKRIKELIMHALEKDEPIESMVENLLALEFPENTIMGPREAMVMNVAAMIRAVKKEYFSNQNS